MFLSKHKIAIIKEKNTLYWNADFNSIFNTLEKQLWLNLLYHQLDRTNLNNIWLQISFKTEICCLTSISIKRHNFYYYIPFILLYTNYIKNTFTILATVESLQNGHHRYKISVRLIKMSAFIETPLNNRLLPTAIAGRLSKVLLDDDTKK